MSKKKVQSTVSLNIAAGKANPAPPVGTALGPRGVNIPEFCKQFNDRTKSMEPGTPIPVVLTIYADKSFDFITKTSPVSYYLKKFANIQKGAAETRKGPYVGSISLDKVKEIAKIKLPDTNAHDVDAVVEMIKGSAESMGLQVK
jgi:large subunit ribosomal protein L11